MPVLPVVPVRHADRPLLVSRHLAGRHLQSGYAHTVTHSLPAGVALPQNVQQVVVSRDQEKKTFAFGFCCLEISADAFFSFSIFYFFLTLQVCTDLRVLW